MSRCVALLWCLAPIAAQGPSVEALLSEDWQVRNAAALALAKADKVDAAALVAILQTDWEGKLPSYTLYGGGRYGGRGPTEPRPKVLAIARTELQGFRQSSIPSYYLKEARDILAPSHPHDLACWVLQQHKTIDDEVPAIDPINLPLARTWLTLRQPNAEQLQAALEGTYGVPVAAAVWMSGNAGRERLRALLPTASQAARRAILRIGRAELFTGAAHIKVLVTHALEDRSKIERKRAGGLLLDHADHEAVAKALAAACDGKLAAVRRAMGYLCLMEAHAAAAVETLIAHAADERITANRAIVALGSFEIPTAMRGRAASVLFDVLNSGNGRSTRLLALDALARCGDGVDARMRLHLQALLTDEDEEALHARLLGCLRQLGCVPTLTTAAKVEIANKDHATTATWLAVADDGADGAKALEPLLAGPMPLIDKNAVIVRLIETAPRVLKKWLDHIDPVLQQQTLTAMPPAHPIEGIDSAKVVSLLSGEPSVAKAAISWLKNRPDAARFAPQIFARIVALTEDWIPVECREFVQDVELPMPQKLDMLAPILKRGYGWEAVRGKDQALLRMECRRWLKETVDPRVRLRLLGELCRAGLETAEDIRMVRESLASSDHSLMNALQEGPVLPTEIRRAVEAILTEEIGKKNYSGIAWAAREVLRTHR